MLFKLKNQKLEPVGWTDFGGSEKELEDLIANSLLDVLFEQPSLMPLVQERKGQPVADIYALDRQGDLFIFEIKVGKAVTEAVQQILRYAQAAGRWSYHRLNGLFGDEELVKAHQDAFQLEEPLATSDFNTRQHLMIVGNSANEELMNAVDYWKKKGILIDFIPYRIYNICREWYLEFFSIPMDRHTNPNDARGILFDTNRTYSEKAVWYMIDNSRVAAFGDSRKFAGYVKPGDIVFLSHRGQGIIAAGRVKKGKVKEDKRKEAWYRDIELLTPLPTKGSDGHPEKAMPVAQVEQLLDKKFFHPVTIKRPYLSKHEADLLMESLKEFLK